MNCKKRLLSTAILFGTLLCLAGSAQAATYYVRTDGGSASQCTGLSDAAYPGSGTARACAFNHPFWAIAAGNNSSKLQGGDTLIIDGSKGAQYMMGWGAPNISNTTICNSSSPWDCYMRAIPSGPSPTQPTRILGKGWDAGCTAPPQLWGTERARTVLNLNGSSNVEIQCLEVTDHSACQELGPNGCNRSSPPFGQWSQNGLIASDSQNVLLKNVNIHGMAYRGVFAGRLRDWTLDNSKIVANSFVGWDGDIGTGASSNSGTISFNKVTIAYSGCGETYPGKIPYNCYSQDQGGYGDGIGTQQTGGNWVFNNVDISHNVSDGLDLLYHNGNGTITIKRSRFEGNAGNQVKVATTSEISNSVLIGNCAYFHFNPSKVWNNSSFNNCRAGGTTLAVSFHTGTQVNINNSTLTGNGDLLVGTSGSVCNGTEKIISRNNIFLGGPGYSTGNTSALFYNSGITGDGDGPCRSVPFDNDYSIIWNTRSGAGDCSGRPNSKCQDPKLQEPIVQYYNGNAYNVNLQSSSPARESGLVLTGKSALDFNNFDRGSVWDMGAVEYGSVAQNAPLSSDTPTPSDPPPATTPGNTPPTVSLVAPGDNAVFGGAPASVNLSASAFDSDGSISRVEFYNGTYKLSGTKYSAPYTYTWNNVQAGSYTLTAKAYDDSGAVTTSSPVDITVGTAPVNTTPTVTLTTDSSVYPTDPASVNLAANVVDPDGTIAKVEFYNGVYKLSGTKYSPPYTYTWNNVQAGNYTLTAKVYDNNGTVMTSQPVSISVSSAPVNVPPAVSLTTNDSVFTSPASVNLAANVVDPDNSVTRVEFYNGIYKLSGSKTAPPYSYTWNNVLPGTYNLTAKVYDSSGAIMTSLPVIITVNP